MDTSTEQSADIPQEQQQQMLAWIIQQWDTETGKIAGFNKKALSAINSVARLTKAHRPHLYSKYNLGIAEMMFQNMYLNKPAQAHVPFMTFMINVTPYVNSIRKRDEEFLFNNYKQVDLLKEFPLDQFRDVSEKNKALLWKKLNDLADYACDFKKYCDDHFSQVTSLASLPEDQKQKIVENTEIMFTKTNCVDSVGKMSNHMNEEHKRMLFSQITGVVPKHVLRDMYGRDVNSMDDVMGGMRDMFSTAGEEEFAQVRGMIKEVMEGKMLQHQQQSAAKDMSQ